MFRPRARLIANHTSRSRVRERNCYVLVDRLTIPARPMSPVPTRTSNPGSERSRPDAARGSRGIAAIGCAIATGTCVGGTASGDTAAATGSSASTRNPAVVATLRTDLTCSFPPRDRDPPTCGSAATGLFKRRTTAADDETDSTFGGFGRGRAGRVRVHAPGLPSRDKSFLSRIVELLLKPGVVASSYSTRRLA